MAGKSVSAYCRLRAISDAALENDIKPLIEQIAAPRDLSKQPTNFGGERGVLHVRDSSSRMGRWE